MPETAFQKQYRQEYVAGFEFKQSMLRAAVTRRSFSSLIAAGLKPPRVVSTGASLPVATT